MGAALCGACGSVHLVDGKALTDAGVVGDVLPNKPTYTNFSADCSLDLIFAGRRFKKTMTPASTQVAPVVEVSGKLDAKGLYTFVLTDPDAPSRKDPLFREFVHHVIVDIPAAALLHPGSKAVGREVLGYVGPAPPYNSGPHRYVAMLFLQSRGEVSKAATASYFASGRVPHRIAEFASMFDLKLVAVSLFQAEWDSTCDESHKKIKFVPPMQYRSPTQLAESQKPSAAPSVAEPAK
uniref:Uncharacterized protein n=1 Tax=Rhizochromulina marina TaxID=1034831 RepID=A0A7S2WP17_9STRA|mmetsp:Transcript_29012/g.84710  ORF Transcript_29012/g.84710 Transcript_29012/m.84710 type:complete len:237 (+) Transcript_29012:113-823(+)